MPIYEYENRDRKAYQKVTDGTAWPVKGLQYIFSSWEYIKIQSVPFARNMQCRKSINK